MRKALLLSIPLFLASCIVSKSKFDKQKAVAEKLKAEKEECLQEKDSLENKLAKANQTNVELNKYIDFLKEDSTMKVAQIAKLKGMYDELSQLYNQLNDEKEDLKKFTTKQKELQQEAIQQREKAIEALKNQMSALQKEMAGTRENEKELSGQLTAKELRIEELEQSLSRQDSLLKSLKKTILAALSGYDDSVLTVTEKNGKLYVTISDKLLFRQGSTQIDKPGVDALKKLSGSLEKVSQDYFIYIEGHTDSIPYKQGAGCIKDNWELSVLRATSVLKILSENKKLNVEKAIPCGRADLVKVASGSAPEQLSKNRRTEIILSPDYKKLLEKLTK